MIVAVILVIGAIWLMFVIILGWYAEVMLRGEGFEKKQITNRSTNRGAAKLSNNTAPKNFISLHFVSVSGCYFIFCLDIITLFFVIFYFYFLYSHFFSCLMLISALGQFMKTTSAVTGLEHIIISYIYRGHCRTRLQWMWRNCFGGYKTQR